MIKYKIGFLRIEPQQEYFLESKMFLKIAKEQTNYYKENVQALIYKGNSIIEFCETPILDKNIKISKYKKRELEKIINEIAQITKSLKESLDLLQ